MFEKFKDNFAVIKGKKPNLLGEKTTNSAIYLSAEYCRTGNNIKYIDLTTTETKYICNKEDLLIIWDGSNSGEVFIGKDGVLSSTMAKLKISNKFLSKYVYYYLKSKFEILNNNVTGAAIPHLSRNTLENLKIYKTTIAEQEEIVNVLDMASDMVRLRKECIVSAQSLIPAIFQEMFGDVLSNKNQNEVCKLKDIANIDRQNISVEQLQNINLPYIGLEHIEKETGNILVDSNENKEINLKSNKFHFSNKHVLYGKLRPYLNKVALPSFEGICSTDIFPILPKENLSDRYFIKYLMSSPYFVNATSSQTSGANLPRIGTSALENIKVFKPDYPLQEQFAQKAQEIEEYIKQQQEELKQSEALFQSLLHHAFTGELTKHKFGEING